MFRIWKFWKVKSINIFCIFFLFFVSYFFLVQIPHCKCKVCLIVYYSLAACKISDEDHVTYVTYSKIIHSICYNTKMQDLSFFFKAFYAPSWLRGLETVQPVAQHCKLISSQYLGFLSPSSIAWPKKRS